MVYRVYVEKKEEYANEAKALLHEFREFLGLSKLKKLRIINRYDVEGISEELFSRCLNTVFSEPPLDNVYMEQPQDECTYVFAVEALPGQYDQRADSCSQCIQFVSGEERPDVRTAKLYYLYGEIDEKALAKIKGHVINPVEAREASMDCFDTLKINYDIPESVADITDFFDITEESAGQFIDKYRLAMDKDDLMFCKEYFLKEKRVPTLTELRMIDTYWSDHCRHTTFSTILEEVSFEDERVEASFNRMLEIRKELGRNKPLTLMEIATLAGRYLKHEGKLDKLDESEEINACTVKIKVNRTDTGLQEDWLLLFKNETHNHPTEIEPFGGAATCIGGAIRDPLSGRAYVYQAMRVTGAADPLLPIEKTIEGKLPQRKLVTTAAAGYSSYGNQIGLATGIVDEWYHPGYAAKRMEIGAVVGAAPADQVKREVPQKGDIVVLLGGRTGRDGCGGATGSSKSHTVDSLSLCGAEVQKGNPPEERKLQRLFRNKHAASMIKRCNDFGAGGVSVAIGELADGLHIYLDKVPKKYDGLDGTELAISESQERMAVVLAPEDEKEFLELAAAENLEATVVAEVTDDDTLVMEWNNKIIVSISREFLNSNGAEKRMSAHVNKPEEIKKKQVKSADDFRKKVVKMVTDLNFCSKRGLSERFDSTIGGGTILMPFGGKYQLSPAQCMVAKIPVERNMTDTCSVMSYGFEPYRMEADRYTGAYDAVVESVAKLVAAGSKLDDCYLTFQEYFERLSKEPVRWGKPIAALLGAFDAQLDLEIAAIGGKDSMSGSFDKLDVPPTLVSFAVALNNIDNVISPEFKKVNSNIYYIRRPENNIRECFDSISNYFRENQVLSAYAIGEGGITGAIFKMSLGNKLGFIFKDKSVSEGLFDYEAGSFIYEIPEGTTPYTGSICIGKTLDNFKLQYQDCCLDMNMLLNAYEDKLEPVFPVNTNIKKAAVKSYSYSERTDNKILKPIKNSKPHVLIPVFPGTNCEYDMAMAASRAGLDTEIFVIKNITPELLSESVNGFIKSIGYSNIIAVPGGFSGGDEPEGSGKFITAFFRNEGIRAAIMKLLKERDGLMCGICNGFQALIKLGLIQYGEIRDSDETMATLTYNTIGRHQSMLVRTRIASVHSPWLSLCEVGDVHLVPVSHGEGRLVCSDELLQHFVSNGQIATQYVDYDGKPSMSIEHNPNGSKAAIEGLLSPDGRVFGKMGHSERYSDGTYKNVPGIQNNRMFEAAYKYYLG